MIHLHPHARPLTGDLVARAAGDRRLLSLFVAGRELIAVLNRADAARVARALQGGDAMASIPGCVAEFTMVDRPA